MDVTAEAWYREAFADRRIRELEAQAMRSGWEGPAWMDLWNLVNRVGNLPDLHPDALIKKMQELEATNVMDEMLWKLGAKLHSIPNISAAQMMDTPEDWTEWLPPMEMDRVANFQYLEGAGQFRGWREIFFDYRDGILKKVDSFDAVPKTPVTMQEVLSNLSSEEGEWDEVSHLQGGGDHSFFGRSLFEMGTITPPWREALTKAGVDPSLTSRESPTDLREYIQVYGSEEILDRLEGWYRELNGV